MKNKLANILIPTAVVAATVAIAAAALATQKYASDQRTNALTPPKTSMGISVSVATVELKSRSVTVRASGFLAPAQIRTISPEVSGYIRVQHHEVSDPVRKDDPVFKIDDTLSKIAVEKSEAALDQSKSQRTLAEENLKKVQNLGEAANPFELTKFSTEHQIAVAAVRGAEAAHHEAGVFLEKTTVESPITGFVSKIYRRRGEFAHTGQPLVELIETDTLKLLVQFDDREVVMFSPGDDAKISIPALPTQTFRGQILRIFPIAAIDSRKFEVEIKIDNHSGELRPGFYAEARLTATPRQPNAQVPAVPRLAIFDIDRREHCFLVQRDESTGRDIAKLARVETVQLLGSPQFAQVLSGLEVGDRVITTGLQHVTDEAVVLIRD